MLPIPVLGTLLINRGDLLLRLFKSIDCPFDKFVIINNGKDPGVAEACKEIEAELPDKVIIINSVKNTGVAGGWNFIIKNFPAPWHFICGNDVMFTPGDLEKMVKEIWAKHKEYVMFFGNQGHNAFAISELAIDNIGYFDENFYPAYLEDSDYSRRIGLTGTKQVDIQDVHIIHGEAPNWGSSTIFSNPRFRIANGMTHGNGHRYYRAKWGGENGSEKFKKPFNNPNLSPKDWALDLELRKNNDIWGI
jgi:GT2 family glycosyltransferase